MNTKDRTKAIRQFVEWYPRFRKTYPKFDLSQYCQRTFGCQDLHILAASEVGEVTDLMKHCLNGEQEYLARAGIERTLQ